MNDTSLTHWGVKGMKWGVRRYQNKDGSLTEAGKKRLSKKYKKMAVGVAEEASDYARKNTAKYYNQTADYMNAKGISEFNASQKKKYGENYASRDGYMSDYSERFNEKYAEFYNKGMSDFYKTSKSYKRAETFAKKYELEKWDDLAKRNSEAVKELHDLVDSYNRR